MGRVTEMAMSKDECLHDCTCCAKGVMYPGVEDIDVRCALPVMHASEDHWDPTWGFWSAR